MSRFRPDGWTEALGRTFEMADFAAGIYVESIAPDLRPAALLVGLLVGSMLWRVRAFRRPATRMPACGRASTRVFWACLGAWAAAWSAWLAASGNGRYALMMILLVGPLLGALVWRSPMRSDWRWLTLALVALLQGLLLHSASPSQTWAMLKTRWVAPDPFADQDALIRDLAPDLIVSTNSQTMTALLVNTESAKGSRLLSLDFADAMGRGSHEQIGAREAIARARRTVLVDAFNADYVSKADLDKLTVRVSSQQLLERFGLTIDAGSCRKGLGRLNTVQIVCALNAADVNPVAPQEAAAPAMRSMDRLSQLCGTSLLPHGARYVQPDGSLVQVFRESRYIVRAAPDGGLYVRWRQDVNFRQRWHGPTEGAAWEAMTCRDLIRRGKN